MIVQTLNRHSVHSPRATVHFDLDDDTQLLQRTVREFAMAEVAPAAYELDRTKSFPYELVAKMAELGWLGLPFPEEVGGAGGTTRQYAFAVAELTRSTCAARPNRRSATFPISLRDGSSARSG